MRLSFAIRAALIALTATTALTTAAYADSGRIRFNVIKAGFVFGGSAGKGSFGVSRPVLSASDRRRELGLYLRCVGHRFRWHGQQHPKPVRC